MLGIAAMHRLSASPMQAPRSSAVGLLTLAGAAVGSTVRSKPIRPNNPRGKMLSLMLNLPYVPTR